jgi:hypothetical protein
MSEGSVKYVYRHGRRIAVKEYYPNVPARPRRGTKGSSHHQMAGNYYMISKPWGDAAAKAAGPYLVLAFRLYRHWFMRGRDVVAVTAAALDGADQRSRQRMVDRLGTAGLIKIVEKARHGRAPRVRIVDAQLIHRVHK